MFGEKEKLPSSICGRGVYAVGASDGDTCEEEAAERGGSKFRSSTEWWCLESNSCSPVVSSRCAPCFRARGQQVAQYPWSQSSH